MGAARVWFWTGTGAVPAWTLGAVLIALIGGPFGGILLLPLSGLLFPLLFGAFTVANVATFTFDAAGLDRWQVGLAGAFGVIVSIVIAGPYGFLLFENETNSVEKAIIAVCLLAASAAVTAVPAWRRTGS